MSKTSHATLRHIAYYIKCNVLLKELTHLLLGRKNYIKCNVLPEKLTHLLLAGNMIHKLQYILWEAHTLILRPIAYYIKCKAWETHTLTLTHGEYYITCKILGKELTQLLLYSDHRTKYAYSCIKPERQLIRRKNKYWCKLAKS